MGGGGLALAGGELTLAGSELALAGGELALAGGQLALAGGKLGLAGGELALAGSKLGLAGGKLALAGFNWRWLLTCAEPVACHSERLNEPAEADEHGKEVKHLRFEGGESVAPRGKAGFLVRVTAFPR